MTHARAGLTYKPKAEFNCWILFYVLCYVCLTIIWYPFIFFLEFHFGIKHIESYFISPVTNIKHNLSSLDQAALLSFIPFDLLYSSGW
jgi:hypothetical protein